MLKRWPFAIFILSIFSFWLAAASLREVPASAQTDPTADPDYFQELIPPDWPDEPGVMPELVGGQTADRPMVFSRPAEIEPNAVTAPTIEVWYGDSQKFGHKGNPQQWVNILGKVSAPAGVKKLEYSIDGGTTWFPLTIGPGNPINMRLALSLVNTAQGYFNIEIDYTDLANGANTVSIRATDNNNALATKQVTVNYAAGSTWSLPYTANWGSNANIQEIAQVVDGNWKIQSGKLIPVDIGYDRLVAIGDETWTDYEVVMPVTVKSLDDSGFQGASNGPGIGIIMRWLGHTSVNGEQPRLDWNRIGGIGWYRWQQKNGPEALELRGYAAENWIGTSTTKVLQFGVPYFFKMNVQGNYYRLKFWKQADPEPGTWDIEGGMNNTASPKGSTLLVAHHVDVEIGNVTANAIGSGPTPTHTNTPKPTSTNTPKPTSTNTPKPTSTNTPKPTSTNAPNPTSTNASPPTSTHTPSPTSTNAPPPTSTHTPEATSTNGPPPTSSSTPEPTITSTPTSIPGLPEPVLFDIVNEGNGNSFNVGWSAVPLAGLYRLDENRNYSGWNNVYEGSDTTVNRAGMSDGIYCYRVSAFNAQTFSSTSNENCTVVGDPDLKLNYLPAVIGQ